MDSEIKQMCQQKITTCNAKGGGFKRGDDNTLDCDLLVVDNGCRHHG
jgi:hypothetical protein